MDLTKNKEKQVVIENIIKKHQENLLRIQGIVDLGVGYRLEDHHLKNELAIIIADIICRSNRVTTHYLGASHPAECLSEAINALKCPYLVLGVVTSDQWDYLENIIGYLEKIDKDLKRKITVILGGASEIDFPEFKNILEIKIIPTLQEFDQFTSDLT